MPYDNPWKTIYPTIAKLLEKHCDKTIEDIAIKTQFTQHIKELHIENILNISTMMSCIHLQTNKTHNHQIGNEVGKSDLSI